jgi:hypothetical protein
MSPSLELRAENLQQNALLQAEALVHQALQTGFVEYVIGEFLVREHGQRRAFRTRSQLGGFFYGEVGILADHRHDHADHDLQTAYLTGFLLLLVKLSRRL